jgi:pyocin large subunit-like protein
MAATPADQTALHEQIAVDDNGIDRAQIRRMLDLTPEERLRRVQEFAEAVLGIRELNEKATRPGAPDRPSLG